MEKTKYTYRIAARLLLEAETPLAVGSGNGDFLTDSLVATDSNGMPYIPGSSIAGVLRHAMETWGNTNPIFGFQNEQEGVGSKIIFTDALMLGEEGVVLDGLQEIPHSPFYERYRHLPIRQHVRIGHQGVNESMGKFDEQVVFKGTRFMFDMELVSDKYNDDVKKFEEMLSIFHSGMVRLGGGTRKGFGKIKLLDCIWREYDLTKPTDLEEYLNKSARLDIPWSPSKNIGIPPVSSLSVKIWQQYELKLSPHDFFIFSSGQDDTDADMTPVTEPMVIWSHGKPTITQSVFFIPASSLKGAIAHRVAYHWFKKKKMFADSDNTCWGNDAVRELFGEAGKKEEGNSIGNVLLDDIFINNLNTKIINHVAIDRFTGGALNGALFTEKVVVGKDISPISISIWVKKDIMADEDIRYAWEQALSDICDGLLPLGGGVGRGNGVFTGTFIKK